MSHRLMSHPSVARRSRRRAVAVAGLVLGGLLLSGCGGGDAPADSDDAASAQPGFTPPSMDADTVARINTCLEAAGLDVELPSADDLPSDMPSGPPSDLPSDVPSDGSMPTDVPTDVGGAAALMDPEVQAALEACGLELPGGPGADAS